MFYLRFSQNIWQKSIAGHKPETENRRKKCLAMKPTLGTGVLFRLLFTPFSSYFSHWKSFSQKSIAKIHCRASPRNRKYSQKTFLVMKSTLETSSNSTSRWHRLRISIYVAIKGDGNNSENSYGQTNYGRYITKKELCQKCQKKCSSSVQFEKASIKFRRH